MDSNLIVLTDQDGNSVRFELLDIVEYKEDEYAVLYPADGGDDDQHERRSEPSRPGNAYRRTEACKHDECHAEARARTDAEHVGAGKRIAEEGLHLKTADRQSCSGQQRDHRLNQSDIQYNFRRRPRAVAARQSRPYIAEPPPPNPAETGKG